MLVLCYNVMQYADKEEYVLTLGLNPSSCLSQMLKYENPLSFRFKFIDCKFQILYLLYKLADLVLSRVFLCQMFFCLQVTASHSQQGGNKPWSTTGLAFGGHKSGFKKSLWGSLILTFGFVWACI